MKLAEAKLADRVVVSRPIESQPEPRPAGIDRRLPGSSQPSNPVYARQARYVPCENCGTVGSNVMRFKDGGGTTWEFRVTFEDGTSRLFRYPTDPGFASGDRVRYESGRLSRM
jgi:hypothetical protein